MIKGWGKKKMTVEDSRNCVSLWLFANKVKHAVKNGHWLLVYGCVVVQQCMDVCLWQEENERKVTNREKMSWKKERKVCVTKPRQASWELSGQKSWFGKTKLREKKNDVYDKILLSNHISLHTLFVKTFL